MSYKDKLAKLRVRFPNMDLTDKRKRIVALNVYHIFDFHKVAITEDILAYAVNSNMEPSNHNDYYYLATMAYLKGSNIRKVAYPLGQGALEGGIEEEFDIEKWSGLVHKIYDAVQKNEMSYDNAVDFYSGDLNSSIDEDEKFKKWIKYYKDGNHLKYNVFASKEGAMKKEADFQFPLSGGGFYPSHTVQPKSESRDEILRSDKKEQFDDWKKKLYVAIRRLDKLLRQGDPHIDSDVHAELADLLHAFDMEVRKVRTAATASDITKRAAYAFNSNGFEKAAAELYKLAQEAPMEQMPDSPIDEADEMSMDDIMGDDFGGDLGDDTIPSPDIEAQAPAESLTPPEAAPEEKPKGGVEEALMGGSGRSPGEYEALDRNITIDVASSKLEEIAGKLADRRVVRLLAEFDIMLDKLGIAPMFPELAEAQSKLIDSYSYALTRVTKMLGMLSSGKSLAEISSAKGDEMQRSIDKDVSKTFSPEEEPKKKEEVISDEFETGDKAPAPAPVAPVAPKENAEQMPNEVV